MIACRNDVLTQNHAIIEEIIALVKKQAAKLSSHPKTAEDIAWRYHLSITEVQQWLSETTWNTETVDLVTAIEPTVNFLHDAELISAKEAEAWATKLF